MTSSSEFGPLLANQGGDGGANVSPAARLDADPSRRWWVLRRFIKTVTTIHINCDMETAFRGASSTEGLPGIFPGKSIIPGVISARIQGGGQQEVGAVRICVTSDGNEVEEKYIQWDVPTAYAYEMLKLKAPLSLMMLRAIGTWQFAPEGAGTRITWSYFGEWTYIFVYPLTLLLVKVFLRGAMDDCLARLKASIEGKPKAQ